MLSTLPRHAGATLIEIAIGLVILSLLLTMGVPAFDTFLQNTRLRTRAESVQAALQLARAEAVKRNSTVEMVLTDDEPVITTVNALAPSTAGNNWVVRSYDPATMFYAFIEGKVGGDSQTTTTAVAASNAIVTFTGFGSTTLGAAATFQFTSPSAGVCAAAGGPVRCLNVVVTPGGQIRMCDPAVTDTGDTRKC
ncbi:MAG: GspH/FimT family pseudopilin [Burkholderiales bacterium]